MQNPGNQRRLIMCLGFFEHTFQLGSNRVGAYAKDLGGRRNIVPQCDLLDYFCLGRAQSEVHATGFEAFPKFCTIIESQNDKFLFAVQPAKHR